MMRGKIQEQSQEMQKRESFFFFFGLKNRKGNKSLELFQKDEMLTFLMLNKFARFEKKIFFLREKQKYIK